MAVSANIQTRVRKHTPIVHKRNIVVGVPAILANSRNERALRVYGSSFGQEIVGDFGIGNPYVIVSKEVDLADGAILSAPFVEFHPWMLVW